MPRHVVALFGAGRAGSIHFHNLLSSHQLTLRYLVEESRERADALLEECNATDMVQYIPSADASKVYNDQDVVAVVVATPTFTHEAIVLEALKHKKAVFCEKPIAQDPAGTTSCYEAAEKAGKPLLCSFNRRFDPSLRILQKQVKNGDAGVIHMLKSTARDSPLPPMEYLKISGGIFHDCAVHDIDLISWVLGEYPISVYTQATANVPGIKANGDVDCVAIILKFQSGIIGTIDLDRDAQYGYDQRLEAFGSKGMIISDFQRPSSIVTYNKEGTHSDVLKFSFPERYAESYVAALNHFIDIIEGKEECEVSKYNTLIVSRIADACEESHRSGLPVTVDLVL